MVEMLLFRVLQTWRDTGHKCEGMLEAGNSLGATGRPKQVPTVALDIQEYGHLSVRLNARGGDESHARGDQPSMRRFEIINAKEEADPPGKLLSND
jgi:hypothetical protein